MFLEGRANLRPFFFNEHWPYAVVPGTVTGTGNLKKNSFKDLVMFI